MKKLIAAVFCLSLSMSACSQPTADQKQEAQTKQLMADADARIGMPRVTNFTEKRLANMIMELRDQPNLATYTYRTDMDGAAHCLGRSIGFGLPYTTQITNPERTVGNSSSSSIIQQPEPNGLFSADSTDATWVLLVGNNGKPEPVYVEDDIIVSISPLRTAVDPC